MIRLFSTGFSASGSPAPNSALEGVAMRLFASIVRSTLCTAVVPAVGTVAASEPPSQPTARFPIAKITLGMNESEVLSALARVYNTRGSPPMGNSCGVLTGGIQRRLHCTSTSTKAGSHGSRRNGLTRFSRPMLRRSRRHNTKFFKNCRLRTTCPVSLLPLAKPMIRDSRAPKSRFDVVT